MSRQRRRRAGRAAPYPDSERGASAVEYALLVAFVASVVLGAVLLLGQGLPALFEADF